MIIFELEKTAFPSTNFEKKNARQDALEVKVFFIYSALGFFVDMYFKSRYAYLQSIQKG
jgi:hypothetical protein